ncbi:Asparagine synthetase domain-containing protein 1 [Geranomyces variabilis]|uniref:Asparagine synthetase domain-containing protein 1 n=1 Tax=Geranomyces variabilis TaxID=109894 RepID=A0AAD5TGV7_9FUNG|nr:Asparagine synthetase domain-containing protein 1 [Geranomyces variabilis]
MCGILFGLFPAAGELPSSFPVWPALHSANALRGPDAHGSASLDLGPAYTGELHGWTLHLRGPHPVTQPKTDSRGNQLCLNGEIFGGLQVPGDSNDTEVLSRALESSERAVLEVLESLRGPWAVVYWQAAERKLYFGRDYLGRRSLLWRKPKTAADPFLLASVSPIGDINSESDVGSDWEEVPADGIYCLQFPRNSIRNQRPCAADVCSTMIRYPWTGDPHGPAPHAPFGPINSAIATTGDLTYVNGESPDALPDSDTVFGMKDALSKLEIALADAVRLRIETIPPPHTSDGARLAVLFSGGLDCICLAALADRFLPPGEPCDLLNVAFENPRRRLAREKEQMKAKKSKKLRPKGQFLLKEETDEPLEAQSQSPSDPPEPPSSQYNVPDRMTGRLGAAELSSRYPHRPWRFVEIDVPYEDALAARARVMGLMHPLNTEMDLSIAIAFWFASRGHGTIQSGLATPYISTAKVLFTGLGADEQLGGYSRHRVAFTKASWPNLMAELQTDIDRLPHRNLGRDDRIMSDHGKEVRFPYLSEEVVETIGAMPVWLKADLRLGRGCGDKLVLRLLCAERLGLTRAGGEPKRAVQFGAASAKMQVGSMGTKGHHVLERE